METMLVTTDPSQMITDLEERKQYFEQECLPLIKEAIAKMGKQAMGFYGCAMLSPGQMVEMYMQVTPQTPVIELHTLIGRCEGDLGKLVTMILEHASQHGHHSELLDKLGVPFKPMKSFDDKEG